MNKCSALRTLLLVATIAGVAHAGTTGTIKGTITDPAGAAVPGAQITVVNEATNESRTQASDSEGGFQFLLLPVGNYTLKVEHASFRTYIVRGIHLDANQVASFDATLVVGTVQASVEVQANSEQVDTAATQVGAVVGEHTIIDLPLNGRNLYQLVALQPGITVPGSPDVNNPALTEFAGAPLAYSSGGGRLTMNNFLVDGGDANGIAENQALIRLIPDAVEEFRVITNTYDAEFGRSAGSVVNLITKSGTNSWHGDLFEFLRNDVLNARGYFELQKAAFKQNQFGGTFGGPIRKNKTFFFASYQGTRNRQGIDASPVPIFSGQERNNGDFSDRETDFSGVLTDPLCFPTGSSGTSCYPSGTAYSTIFPGAKIPTADFNPVSANILTKYIPPPNAGTNLLSLSPVQPDDNDIFSLKINHELSARQRLSALYYFYDDRLQSVGVQTNDIPGFPVVTDERTQDVNLSDTFIANPTTLNEFRIAYLRDSIGKSDSPVVTGSPASFGFTGIATGGPANLQSLPVINIAGGPQFGGQGSGSGGGRDVQNTLEFADNFTKVLGRHSLKFGADYRHINYVQELVYEFDGDFTFDAGGPNTTGDPFADFILGLPDFYTQGAVSYEHLTENEVNLYAQDSWQIRHDLTFNYGLRWEVNTPFTDRNNAIETFRFPAPGQPPQQSTVFPTAPPGLLFPGDTNVPAGLFNTNYRGFSPRIGIAYSPGWLGPNKLVIRAAYGLFYNPIEQLVLLQFNGDPPYGGSSGVAEPGFANPYIDQSGATHPSPFPFVPPTRGQTIDFSNFYPIYSYGNVPLNLQNQYVEQFNLLFEYQLSPTMVAAAGYVGSQGHHLLATYDGNPGNPQLCLQLAAQGCGPYGEDSNYVGPSGQTLFGTRPAGVFSNNGVTEAFANIFYENSISNSNYNSLQTRLEKRAANMQFEIAYTFSKSIDNASGFENLLNPFCYRCDRNLSAFNARHRVVFNWTYSLGLKRFASGGFEEKLLDGWEIGGIYTYQSGLPVHMTDTGSDNSLTGGFDFEPADRPAVVAPIQINGPYAPNHQYFSPNSFAVEPLGTFGNASHNIFAGPPIDNVDFNVIKRTKIHENLNIEFRAEFFNLLNHTQFLNPDGNISDAIYDSSGAITGGTFGQILSARDPRFIQFGLKLAF